MTPVRIKVCGITREEDALRAAELGADAVGFVFWPGSPRCVEPSRAREIAAALPPFVARVGVFVDAGAAGVRAVADLVGLDAIQLHGGGEEPDPGTRILRAVSLRGGEDPDALDRAYPGRTLLLDAHDADRRGGTGKTVDWNLAARVARRRRIILAGGLSPENVERAVREVRPWGVDVSSGVETRPGIKSPDRMAAFVAAVRRGEAGGAAPCAGDGTSGPRFGRRDPAPGGWYGAYGGRFVPETLVAPVAELEKAYLEARGDLAFRLELARLLRDYAGRPTPLYEARRLTADTGGARILLKREDLAHTGAHKINNAIGQALLARRMGKRRLIAETGAGQHGVATATAAALLGLDCEVYMGAEDMERQAPNVFRMELLGARVVRVESGTRTLKDAINEAMRDWVARVEDTHYLLGSVLGPHPYPLMVRELQSVIGAEAREQCLAAHGRLPNAVVACVGGGSNALGIFDAFVDDSAVRLVGVEAGGTGLAPGRHAARFAGGSPGVLHGARTWILQDEAGNIEPTHSVSAGLDYAAIGPEHAYLREAGRAEYAVADDEEALAAFRRLARAEGILAALESSHAVAGALRLARELGPRALVVVNLSGRGDKDVPILTSASSPEPPPPDS